MSKEEKPLRNRCRKTPEEANAYLQEFLAKYANDERILRMRLFPHHPPVTAYAHSLGVVKAAAEYAGKHHLNVDWEVMLLAALLHDFYLYDFSTHTAFHNCFAHPNAAAKNAEELFDANHYVIKAIKSHMFPVIPWRFPTSKEARVVSIADKIASMKDVKKKK